MAFTLFGIFKLKTLDQDGVLKEVPNWDKRGLKFLQLQAFCKKYKRKKMCCGDFLYGHFEYSFNNIFFVVVNRKKIAKTSTLAMALQCSS